jgi:hypothetical protein
MKTVMAYCKSQFSNSRGALGKTPKQSQHSSSGTGIPVSELTVLVLVWLI